MCTTALLNDYLPKFGKGVSFDFGRAQNWSVPADCHSLVNLHDYALLVTCRFIRTQNISWLTGTKRQLLSPSLLQQ